MRFSIPPIRATRRPVPRDPSLTGALRVKSPQSRFRRPAAPRRGRVPVGSPADAAVVTPLARAESLERRVCLAATVMDATFGAGGAATVDVAGLLDSATTVQALPDGKIMVGGFGTTPLGTRAALLRLNATGTPDAGFGVNGLATPGTQALLDTIYAIAVQPDGKVLVGGYRAVGARANALLLSPGDPNNPAQPTYGKSFDDVRDLPNLAFAVARYNADGTPDQSF